VLNQDGIAPPRLHYCLRQNREPSATSSTLWQLNAIPKILRDEVYLGHTISLKYTRSYRSSKGKRRSEDEWLKIPDTHIAIIDSVTWDKAQAVNAELAKWVENAREPQTALYAEKLFCGDCKRIMMPHSEKRYRSSESEERRNTYSCKTYHVSGRQSCTRHGINEEALNAIILKNIRQHVDLIVLDEKRIAAELRKKLIGDYSVDKDDIQKQLRELKHTLHTLDMKLEQFYEDKVTGTITTETFIKLADKMKTERSDISKAITLLEQDAKEAKTKLGDIQNWIRLIKENAAVNYVDRTLLDILIERVEICESIVVNGEKTQDVTIIYRFVGVV
jgi:hypothetical protein